MLHQITLYCMVSPGKAKYFVAMHAEVLPGSVLSSANWIMWSHYVIYPGWPLWQELHILAEHKSFYEADNKSWWLFVLYSLHIQVTIMYTNLILVGEGFSTSNLCLFLNITNYPTALSDNQFHCFRQIFLPTKTDLHMCCHKPRDLPNMNVSDYRYIGYSIYIYCLYFPQAIMTIWQTSKCIKMYFEYTFNDITYECEHEL